MSIIRTGDTFSIRDISATYDKLPVGNYLLKYNERDGYYLVKKDPFVLPPKIYGSTSIIDRWLKSWEVNSHKNLGILLSGLKGSGKTILAQKFCIEANLPVIIINEYFSGSDFIDFLTSPKLGKSIIFIDEFEKIFSTYDESRDPHDLLSLMDGNYSTRLIFLLTVNEYNISQYLTNRLNRIKYHKSYEDLDPEVMEETIEDLLLNKKHKKSIYDFFDIIGIRAFDILVNLIKEMNLFNEDAITCGYHLNVRIEEREYEAYEIFEGNEYRCFGRFTYPFSRDRIYIERNPSVINRIDANLKHIKNGKDTNKKPTKKAFENNEKITCVSSFYLEVPSDIVIDKKDSSISINDSETGINLVFRLVKNPHLFSNPNLF